MKRKRGKKGKSKKAPKVGTTEADPNVVNSSAEDVSGPDDNHDTEKDETNSRMDTETPSSTGTGQPEKPSPIVLTGVIDKPVGRLVYNRVKVKIKPSKALEPQITSSDAHTHSDTDKSSQHMCLEKQVVSDKVEDSANSVPENNAGVSTTQPKKAGSIKIKSSKGFSSSLSPCNNSGPAQAERTHQKEPEPVSRDSVYNKQELKTSLEVIQKIIKMDAAEPFNVPVNPVALGIPDYFDVIKTPMDFGTICRNLESGLKYMNSEDVYKDVRYIWENCYKYNNKGDYILELMKRVKKNFSKYWSAAGLYSEQPQSDMKDGNASSHGKSGKGGHSKHKSRKRHRVKRHKDDCLCAICIMMRRRQEREQIVHSADDQTETSDGLVQEVKPEGTSTAGTPNDDDDTSSSTENSQNQDADGEMEDKGEVTLQRKQEEEKGNETPSETNKENGMAEQSHLDGNSGVEKHEDIEMAESGDARKDDGNNEEKPAQHEDETAAVEHQKPKELSDAGEKAKVYGKLRKRYENPMVVELCASLFPENPKSVWSRPHSLVNRRGSSRNSAIGAAIATFMKL